MRLQGFDQKLKEKQLKKKIDKKLHFTYPLAFIKDVQALGDALNSQRRTSSKFINFFGGHFALVDPDPGTH
jgi:hypothetical protein